MPIVHAGLLAAGSGERFQRAGFDLPKPLIPVSGIPLIGRTLRLLESGGIREVYCIIHEAFAEAVLRYVRSLSPRMAVRWVVRTTPSSMHSLLALAPFLKSHDRFLVVTVDAVADPAEFQGFLRAGEADGAWDGLLACTGFVRDEMPLRIRVDPRHRILEFGVPTTRMTCVTAGLYVFRPRIFEMMSPALRQGVQRLRNFLRFLAERGYRFQGFHFSKVIDVDDPEDLAEAEQWLEGLQRRGPPLAPEEPNGGCRRPDSDIRAYMARK